MTFLTLSDTHNKHKQIPEDWLLPADGIIHAGDISSMGHLHEIENFLKWFSSLEQYKYKIFCAGNHDFGFEFKQDRVKELLEKYPNIIYLQDTFVIIDGIKIYGSPHTPYFYNWAFNLQRGEEIKKKWDLIDYDTHILITHGPVYGILDTVPDGSSVGCVDLLNTINDRLLVLKAYICGHIHCSSGIETINDIIYVNAAVLNEKYEVQYRPRLIEVNI